VITILDGVAFFIIESFLGRYKNERLRKFFIEICIVVHNRFPDAGCIVWSIKIDGLVQCITLYLQLNTHILFTI
jgi:hypothetical protein